MVRVKENLKLSYGGSSQREAPGTNPSMEVLGQALHWIWVTLFHAIKVETIENHDLY